MLDCFPLPRGSSSTIRTPPFLRFESCRLDHKRHRCRSLPAFKINFKKNTESFSNQARSSLQGDGTPIKCLPAEARSGLRSIRAAGRRRRRTLGAPASSWSGRWTRRAARARRSPRTSCPPWRLSPRTPGTGTAPSPAPSRRIPSASRRRPTVRRRTEPHCLEL